MFSQRDPRWSGKKLGNSGLTCYNYGCLITDISQALVLAGYNTDPGQVIDKLNPMGGLANGLVQWGVLVRAYPQITYGGSGYEFVQGMFGKASHFVLRRNGVIYEPWYGVNSYPSSWRPTGIVRRISIAPAINPAPAPPSTGFPKTVTVTSACNVRSIPSTAGVVTSTLRVGDTFVAIALVDGQSVGGNNKWYKSQFNHYVWSQNIK